MAKPTLEELENLKAIADAQKFMEQQEERRKLLAANLGICPECGEKLIQENLEVLDEAEKYFFGLFQRRFVRWDYRRVCPKDKKHFEEKYDYPSYERF